MEQATHRTPDAAPQPNASNEPLSRDLVPLDQAHNHVGEMLKIVSTDDRHFNGKLVSDDGTELVFEKLYASGTIQVSWAKDEIRSLHKVDFGYRISSLRSLPSRALSSARL